jgi:4,4'-diaponeurosporenoate glycosyltransferase
VTVTLAMVAAGWLAGTVLLWRLRTPAATDVAGLAGSVSVIVPARNEASNLPRLLASLAAQAEPPLEVLVVDDGSTDGTAAVARAAGVGVVEPGLPPAGWLGKPWALRAGVAAASGDRLLLLDADTWLSPDGIARLAAAHEELAPAGLLSVQPFHAVERPYEHLSAVGNVVPVLASGMAAPGPPATTVAFGPCLVTSAAALEAVGGFEAVRHEVVEDAALAHELQGVGRRVVCLGGGSTVAFRMYPGGFRALVDGWTRTLAHGVVRARPWPVAGAVLWVTAGLSVMVGAVTNPSLAMAVSWLAVAVQLWWMLRRLGSFHWLTAALFPIPLLTFVGLFARSLVWRLSRRPLSWRGRRVTARP